jgi:hypothetical protein
MIYNLYFFVFLLDILQPSTPSTVQTQSQPSTMFQNPVLSTQTSQSCSYTAIPPSSNDINKQIIPSSSSSTITESIENSRSSISPSHTNEAIQSSIPSDTSTTTQPPVNKIIFKSFVFFEFLFLLDIG